jgi:predicted ATP-dependent endonuclease of OLD family
MLIESFEIASYRSCLRAKFLLQPDLTGLIGVNASGKSNLLNAIALLKKIIRSRPPIRPEDSSSRNTCRIALAVRHRNKAIHIRGNVIYETDEHNRDDIYASQLKFNFREFTGESKWIRIPIQYFGSARDDIFMDSSPLISDRQMYMLKYYSRTGYVTIHKSKEIQQHLSEIVTLFSGINYYSASQFSDPSQCPVSIELEEERPVRRARFGAGRLSHEQFMFDLYRSHRANDRQYKRYLNTIGREGIGLVDSVQFPELEMPSSYYKAETGGKISKIERNKLLVVPIFTVNNTELSPNQLSEGTFKTLALVFYILTDDSRVLLIEEPEVCVHHGLLSSIISLIKTQSKKKQIVMSTHSDFVLDHLDPDNLLLVEWSAEKGTTAKPLNKSMSKDDYKALRVYLKESGNLGEYWRESGF